MFSSTPNSGEIALDAAFLYTVRRCIALAVWVIFVCLEPVVITPLEVLAVRLSVQRNHSRKVTALHPFGRSEVSEEGTLFKEEGMKYTSKDKHVIMLRDDERSPYAGLLDAFKKIQEEEGLGTLYRLWWVNFLGIVLSRFSLKRVPLEVPVVE